MKRIRGAFTLIELLTVIMIIGILSSLLLPAISASRERGRIAYCTGSLGQIGKGLILYADANRDYLPPVGVSGDTNSWALRVLTFVGNETNIFWCPSDPLRPSSGIPRTFAVNAGFDSKRYPCSDKSATIAMRMADLDQKKGDMILVSERLGTSGSDRGMMNNNKYAALERTPSTVHSKGKQGNYLMASAAVRLMRTNEVADITDGSVSNFWFAPN